VTAPFQMPQLRRRYRAVRTPSLIQTEDLECGVVSLAIVLAFYGRWAPMADLRAACGVSRNGATAASLVRAARFHGLKARALRAEPAHLTKIAPPAILHWNLTHYVVFEGLGRNGSVRINDPQRGRYVASASEIDESMTGVVLTFSPSDDFKPMGHAPGLFRSLRRRLTGASLELSFLFILGLLLLVPSLLIPSTSSLFIDYVLLRNDSAWVVGLATVAIAVFLWQGILVWLQYSFLLRFEAGMAIEGAYRFFWQLLHLPISFFNQRMAGDLSSRIDANDRLAGFLTSDIAVTALRLLAAIFFACIMAKYDVVLTIVSICIATLNISILRLVSRRRADSNMRLLREEEKLNDTALWGLEMIEDLKATSSEGEIYSRWAGQQAKVINLRQRLEKSNLMLETLPPLLGTLNMALILGFGGARVIENSMSLGAFAAFQVLAFGFIAPVNHLAILGQRIQLAEAEMAFLDDVLREPVAHSEDEDTAMAEEAIPLLSGRLELNNVTFGYARSEPPTIEAVNLTLIPGGCVAVVGKTGSGKSTLASLIAGLYEPWSGDILFDGKPRSGWPRAALLRSIAVVSQDICVFEGTVYENLTLWNQSVTEEQVQEAARDACILDEILSRPKRFDALIEVDGSNWSGGELQRIEVARALVRNPSLLILDEATSNLDPDAEWRIVHNLRNRGCACLIVAHRLSTIRNADEIIVLRDGIIVERGTHQSLVQLGAEYLNLIAEE
jgi:NHLM bacteriocin system ABC transporter peptidase/ATP-binding protein